MRGKPVTSLEELEAARLDHRSVIGEVWNRRPMPAAVLMNMSGTVILRRLRRGLWIYEKPKRRDPFGTGGFERQRKERDKRDHDAE